MIQGTRRLLVKSFCCLQLLLLILKKILLWVSLSSRIMQLAQFQRNSNRPPRGHPGERIGKAGSFPSSMLSQLSQTRTKRAFSQRQNRDTTSKGSKGGSKQKTQGEIPVFMSLPEQRTLSSIEDFSTVYRSCTDISASLVAHRVIIGLASMNSINLKMKVQVDVVHPRILPTIARRRIVNLIDRLPGRLLGRTSSKQARRPPSKTILTAATTTLTNKLLSTRLHRRLNRVWLPLAIPQDPSKQWQPP
jgi:hypothetical protein